MLGGVEHGMKVGIRAGFRDFTVDIFTEIREATKRRGGLFTEADFGGSTGRGKGGRRGRRKRGEEAMPNGFP